MAPLDNEYDYTNGHRTLVAVPAGLWVNESMEPFQADHDIILIPDHIVTEKQSTIVLNLQDDIPPSVRSVTVELRHESTGKLEFLVAVKLGNDALLLRVPEMKQAGDLEGIIKLDGKTSPKYPPFVLPVLTPLDTLFHNSIKKGKHGGTVRNHKAVLAAAVAYLTTLKSYEADKEANADVMLEQLVRIQGERGKKVPVMVKDICAGKQTCDESLLHFTLRHGLVKLLNYLLEPESPVNKRQLISNLGQESYDCLTPQFLAKANYRDVLPKLKQIYKDEIGSHIGRKSSLHPQDTGRKHSKISDFMMMVSRRRRRSSAAKTTPGSRPRSEVFDGRKRSSSWNDLSSHLDDDEDWQMLQQRHPQPMPRSRSIPCDPDSDDDQDTYIPMYPAAQESPTVHRRKISVSVDAGLDLLSKRPLPRIPSMDSDEEGDLQKDSIYEQPRWSIKKTPELIHGTFEVTSPTPPSESPIYDTPPPGIRPAAVDKQGQFQTHGAWSKLGAEPSGDKDIGKEEEEDPKVRIIMEDELGCSATLRIPDAGSSDDYDGKDTHAVVQFLHHEHN